MKTTQWTNYAEEIDEMVKIDRNEKVDNIKQTQMDHSWEFVLQTKLIYACVL